MDTSDGERFRLETTHQEPGLKAVVRITRPSGKETLKLERLGDDGARLQSSVAPQEPHEFDAELELEAGGRREVLPFRMVEPAHEHH